jgi:hypothetical protein
MKVFLAAMFAAVTVQAQNEIVKIEITEPTTMCSRFACVKLAVGEAGIYNNNFIDGKRLAYGTLHEISVIGSVAFPAGTLVRFQTPAQEDYDGMDFSAVYKEEQTLGGVKFAAGTEVSFDRFYQVYLPVEKKLAQVEHNAGFIKVKGVPTEEVTIQNVTVTNVIFETSAYRIRTAQIKDLILFAGSVTRDSVYRSVSPVYLITGSFIRIYKGPYAQMNVTRNNGFVVEPFGYKASNATFHMPSGRLTGANILEPTNIQGHHVLGDVSFHENGLLSLFAPAYDVLQSIDGVVTNGRSTYYFDIELHDTGHALSVPTTLVKENLEFLSADIARGLPDDLDGDMGRLQFFFNPEGKIRALVVEGGFSTRPRRYEIYLVHGEWGSYKFQSLDLADSFALKIRSSTRGYVQEEVVSYLKEH